MSYSITLQRQRVHVSAVSKTLVVTSFIAVILSLTATADGHLITFEKTPTGATPVDNAALSRLTPYVSSGIAVTFGFDTDFDGIADVDAVFEQRGQDTENGFFSTYGPAAFDTERPGSSRSLGNFFLREPNSIGSVTGNFVISYNQDVSAFSGEIWDIDAGASGYEQWKVSAFDSSGNFLESITSPKGKDFNDPTSLDSLAWVFSMSRDPSEAKIRRVEFEFIGSAPIVGLAFDNYNATSAAAVPEPSTISIFATLAIFGGIYRLRRQRMGNSNQQ